ncbi:MAG TPA: transcriptional repressor [Candidatus Dormibacteraeota bacterium]|nr:transcriptional repressor [Candidatus Dormibacteraeota bacterium]
MPRPSSVRDAVADLLRRGGRHAWSIEELHRELIASGRRADQSSVFRAVTYLHDRGQLVRVVVDGKARYEVASPHHDHVRCEGCGALAPLPGCVLEGLEHLEPEVKAGTGFAVTGHQLVLTGRCPRCQRDGR